MRRSRKLLLGAVVVVCIVCTFMSGCCLTNRLWQIVADEPQELVAASLTEERVLHLAVRYEDGLTWHLRAILRETCEGMSATARRVGVLEGDLPPSAFRRGHEQGELNLSFSAYDGIQGNREHRVWVDGVGCFAIVTLPEPIPWSTPAPWLAALATPFTLLVDVATAPIWVLWVVMTAGGHGDCWLPWCNYE